MEPEPKNTVEQFTEEELKALTEDLQEVLVKHNAEMGVTSTINLMKVAPTPADVAGVPPVAPPTDDNKEDNKKEEVEPASDTETKKGG